MHLPFPENYFDGVYAIEATCHAPRREDVYGEIFRVLKPGQVRRRKSLMKRVCICTCACVQYVCEQEFGE